MRRRGGAVFAVDLFADVLVRADGVTYQVCDLDELDRARLTGLILPAEARGARSGLAELTGIIERGDLLAFLSRPAPSARWTRRAQPLPAARLSPRFRCSVKKAGAWLGHDELPHTAGLNARRSLTRG
jgi:hypothetical protein